MKPALHGISSEADFVEVADEVDDGTEEADAAVVWCELPPDVVIAIASQLDMAEDLVSVGAVCSNWRAMVEAADAPLWKPLAFGHFPHLEPLLRALPSARQSSYRSLYRDHHLLERPMPQQLPELPATRSLSDFVFTVELRWIDGGLAAPIFTGTLETHLESEIWRNRECRTSLRLWTSETRPLCMPALACECQEILSLRMLVSKPIRAGVRTAKLVDGLASEHFLGDEMCPFRRNRGTALPLTCAWPERAAVGRRSDEPVMEFVIEPTLALRSCYGGVDGGLGFPLEGELFDCVKLVDAHPSGFGERMERPLDALETLLFLEHVLDWDE